MKGEVHAQNTRGQWVPAITLPLYTRFGVQCGCGTWFLRVRRYREHYAFVHILGMSHE